MRRLAAFIAASLVLAAPAVAQQAKSARPPSVAAAGLRRAEPPQAPAPEPPMTPLPVTASLAPAQTGDAGRCRMACAQTYYFCLPGDDADICAPAWGQCRAACVAPAAGVRR